ncbi:Vps52 [Babesia duncani]|uniref:Vps52 n=1 Tax=Babesia duncani TaxID=323732 RepID=A0AAD9UNJ7_9APIC|nr:Vps52 [Babesia duncani]
MKESDLEFLRVLDASRLAKDFGWYLGGVDNDSNLGAIHPKLNPLFHQHSSDSSKLQDYSLEQGEDAGHEKVLPELLEVDASLHTFLLQCFNWCMANSKTKQQSVVDTLLEYEKDIHEFSMDLNFCDSTLKLVENALMKHYSSLKNASVNIENLHKESAGVSYGLRNRQLMFERLQKFLNDVLIMPNLIKMICNDPVNQNYMNLVNQYIAKRDFLKANYPTEKYPCLVSSRVQIKKLHLVIVRRIYNYLVEQVSMLAMSKSNIFLIQDTKLLRLKPLFVYLEANSALGLQVCRLYIHTMNKTYTHLFGNYLLSLNDFKQKNPYRDVNVIIKHWSDPNQSCFVLGHHKKNLYTSFNADPIVIAGLDQNSLKTEDIVRSYMKLLVDTASTEYQFITSFFSANHSNMLLDIFLSVIQVLSTRLRSTLKNSYDVVCMCLLYKLIEVNLQLLQRRGLTIFDDSLLHLQLQIIAKRAKFVLEEYTRAIEAQFQSSSFNSNGPARALDGCINSGHLCHAIFELEQMSNTSIWTDIICNFLTSLYKVLLSFGCKFKNVIKQSSFYISNCMAILGNLGECAGTLVLQQFQKLLDQQLGTFSNAILQTYFPQVLQLLAKVESDSSTKTIDRASTASLLKQEMIQWLVSLDGNLEKVGALLTKFQPEAREIVKSRLLDAFVKIYTPIYKYMEANFSDQWFNSIPKPTSLSFD